MLLLQITVQMSLFGLSLSLYTMFLGNVRQESTPHQSNARIMNNAIYKFKETALISINKEQGI